MVVSNSVILIPGYYPASFTPAQRLDKPGYLPHLDNDEICVLSYYARLQTEIYPHIYHG
jgi:hypothetical protein